MTLRERVARKMFPGYFSHGTEKHRKDGMLRADAAIREVLTYLPEYIRRDGRKNDRFLSGWESEIVENAIAAWDAARKEDKP